MKLPFKSALFNSENIGEQIIRIRDIPNNKTKTYSPEPVNDPKYRVNNGDILIGMDGNFHMCKWAGGASWLNQRVTRIKPKENCVPAYLLYLSLMPIIHNLNQIILGTTVAHLGDEHLRKIFMVVPEDHLCKICSDIFEPMYQEEINLLKKNENLRQQRDLLLPRLVSGELDVSDLAIPGNDEL